MARKPAADSPQTDEDYLMLVLGERIRALRKARKLTLKQLGQSSDLSHAFLSQLERGLTTASITTLNRISRTLETTISALLANPAAQEVDVLRESDGIRVPRTDTPNGAVVRSLTRLDWPVQPLEYTGGPTEFEEFFQHPGHELIYVVTGRIELEFESGRRERLGPTEVASYPGALPHRWRVLGDPGEEAGDPEVRLLLIVSRQ